MLFFNRDNYILTVLGVGQTVVRLLWVENQWFYVWSVRNVLEERGF